MNASQRILIVDDSPSATKLMAKHLTGLGYNVTAAASGAEALAIIEREAPFDLISLDRVMKGLDGFETCRRIRSLEDPQKSNVPIIFITSQDTMEMRARGFAMGAANFLGKDGLLQQIGPTIDRILSPLRRIAMRVMVVDDSSVARSMIVTAMKEIFTEVEAFENGEKALSALHQAPDHFDFIITDHEMPKMTGIELTRKVRLDLGIQMVPIVLLTAATGQTPILSFFKAGGTDYISKPYINEELTARIRAHAETRTLHKALETSVKELRELHKSKDDFLATCSHDLKTPLNAIMGFAELIKEDSTDEQACEDLDKILEAAKTLHSLIGNITDLYRVQSAGSELKFEPVDLGELVHTCLKLLESLASRKGIKLKYPELNEPITARGNPLALKRVINNLLSNALKFTESGGEISVSLCRLDGKIRMEVKDSGVGMDHQALEGLFKTFTESSRAGTSGEASVGLGLMICKEIIERHGGQIHVESRPGAGCKFSFELMPEHGLTGKQKISA